VSNQVPVFSNGQAFVIIGLVLIILFGSCGGCYFGGPIYNVWERGKAGEAQLMQAKQNRQIKIEEAEANLAAQKLNAQAEVERAKGMAEAMEIENGQLSTEYIQYLWVRGNKFNQNTTIYIPTETGLPLLEASRIAQPQGGSSE
jgi:hypothetical protein